MAAFISGSRENERGGHEVLSEMGVFCWWWEAQPCLRCWLTCLVLAFCSWVRRAAQNPPGEAVTPNQLWDLFIHTI